MSAEILSPEVQMPHNLEADLSLWENRLDRLESVAVQLSPDSEYPEWWYEEEDIKRTWSIAPQLKNEGGNPDQVGRYAQLLDRESRLKAVINGREHDQSPLEQAIYNLGPDVVGTALRNEDNGYLHTSMLDALEYKTTNPQYFGSLSNELETLKVAYGVETVTDLLTIQGDDFSDRVRGTLTTPKGIQSLRYIDNKHNSDLSWQENQTINEAWIQDAISKATGLSSDEAKEYAFSASRRAENESISRLLHNFEHFGAERIKKITKTTGIRGLEDYSVEQLERMEAFIDNPDEFAERMHDHDVNVVMINRVGDHNGVFEDASTKFDDETGRTLFFEIASMADIYRHMVTMKRRGIKPSTLVLGGHSAPGQFMVSDDRGEGPKRRDIATIAGRGMVEYATGSGEISPFDYGYSLHRMKGAARLVTDFMQPSRGIDDPDDDKGRVKIIFKACHAADEVKAKDVNEYGENFEIGTESVISQLGKDLQRSGIDTSVDIYGGTDGIQMKRTDKGIVYTGQPDSMGTERTQKNAHRIRLEHKKLTKAEVSEIILRK